MLHYTLSPCCGYLMSAYANVNYVALLFSDEDELQVWSRSFIQSTTFKCQDGNSLISTISHLIFPFFDWQSYITSNQNIIFLISISTTNGCDFYILDTSIHWLQSMTPHNWDHQHLFHLISGVGLPLIVFVSERYMPAPISLASCTTYRYRIT